jgi:hypothetical protein
MRILSGMTVAAALGFFAAATTVQAAEVSLLSGVYKKVDEESDGEDAGGKSEISAGGRYSDQMDARMFWFGQGTLTMRSFKGDGPSDSTSLRVGGGVRYYFTKLAESISPFAYGLGEFRSDKDARGGTNSYTETEENGLYYGGFFGIRLSLDPSFFVDFETPLFDSALFATEKSETTTVDPTGKKTSTEDETKRTELFVASTGALSSIRVALGMRL